MTDLVYILGTASCSNNLELKYSLASVEKFCTNAGRVYVVGEHPGFEGNFIHIPDADRGKNKQDNIRLKILTACEHPEISDPFLFLNDDYIFTKPFECSSVPNYYNTNLTIMWKGKRKPGHYKSALLNTLIELSEKNLPLRHYDIHMPILYHKDKFIQAMDQFNWGTKDGFVIKSLYCNAVGVDPVLMADPKVVPAYSDICDMEQEIKDWPLFSFDDISFNETMKEWLKINFPEVENICV